MNRRLMSLLLVLALGVAALAGCSAAPAESGGAVRPLTWDGSALSGAPFNKRVLPVMTIHYAKPTMPSAVERLGTMVAEFLDKHQAWGRLLPGERIDLWIIPDGYSWPTELPPLDRRERPARAVKPRVVVLEDRLIPTDVREGFLLRDRGVYAAVATAVTQRESSPAYTIGWLHDGMGGVFSEPWRFFPAGPFTRDFSGTAVGGLDAPRNPAEILKVLDDTKPVAPYQMTPLHAATGLAALVMDRWGLDWPDRYPKTPEELTPEAALLWATGAPNIGAAIKSGTDRMQRTLRTFFLQSADMNHRVGGSLNDQGLNRLKPPMVAPATPDSDSARAYQISVDWDPATRTVSGEERLTWTNGEGVPLSRLYFNVWGNASPQFWHGGFSTVESVLVDGRPAAFTFRGMDLEVELGRIVAPGQTAEVTIRFATRLAAPVPLPPHVGVLNPLVAGTNARKEDVWPLTLWYPALARLDEEGWHLDSFPEGGILRAEVADYDVSVTVPAGSRVSAPYIDATVTDSGERTTYRFRVKNQLEWKGRVLVDK